MKVRRIVIELDLDPNDNPNHATEITFENGLWAWEDEDLGRGIYPRLLPVLDEMWKMIRRVIVSDQYSKNEGRSEKL